MEKSYNFLHFSDREMIEGDFASLKYLANFLLSGITTDTRVIKDALADSKIVELKEGLVRPRFRPPGGWRIVKDAQDEYYDHDQHEHADVPNAAMLQELTDNSTTSAILSANHPYSHWAHGRRHVRIKLKPHSIESFTGAISGSLKVQMLSVGGINRLLRMLNKGIKCNLCGCILPCNEEQQKSQQFGRSYLILASKENPGKSFHISHTCKQGGMGCISHAVSDLSCL